MFQLNGVARHDTIVRMNCPRCATINLDGAVTCASCGAALAAPPPPGAPPPGYPPPGGYYPPQAGYYPPPGYPPPYAYGPQRTSGMAIAGFVLSLVVCGILGLIFSIMGRNEVRNSGGTVGGGGLATAGIVISIIRLVLEVIYIVVIVAAVGSTRGDY